MEGANAGSTRGQVLRFGALGGANTALTTAAFYLLAWVLPAEVAFTIVYAAGIVFVVLTTPRYVFRATASWSRRLALAGWYVAVYLVGLGMVAPPRLGARRTTDRRRAGHRGRDRAAQLPRGQASPRARSSARWR